MPLTSFVRSLYNTIREKLSTLNLFDSRSTDPKIVRREILSSRLFICLLTFSIIILIFYTFTGVQIKNQTINEPTQSVYNNLQQKYANTLQCPCKRISIPYGKFVNTIPLFHQVCSSDFISQFWIDFTFEINTTLIWPIDVRRSMSAIWQTINTLCQTSINITLNSLNQFSNTPIISSVVLSEQLLKSKIQAALDSLRQISSATVIRPLTLIHGIAQANELVSALSTNYIAVTEMFGLAQITVSTDDESTYVGTFANRYILNGTTTVCTCQNNISCPIPANLYFYDAFETYGHYNLNIIEANKTLPGIIIDCFPLKMALASSLECFYDQSCLNILLSGYQNSINISILDQSKSTRFLRTTTIGTLINELFIEQIDIEIMFDRYYYECAPIYCHYVYSSQYDLVYVITVLIALLGGLSTGLYLITPYLVQLGFFLKQKRSTINQSESLTKRDRLKGITLTVRKSAGEFNIFSQHSRDHARIHHGRIASRLYIIMLILTISVLIVYISTSAQTIVETVESPTQEQYEKLFKQHGQILKCLCSSVSIPYGEFLQIIPIYHEVCSSDFVQQWWYQSLLPLNQTDASLDFISAVSSHFQALSTFCKIANLTIADALGQFSSTLFVTNRVLPHDLFVSQTGALIQTFLQLTKSNFRLSISLTDAVLQSNQYVSSLMTNTALNRYHIPQLNQSELGPIRISSSSRMVYDEDGHQCICLFNSTCSFDNMIMINNEVINFYSELPGIHASCFTVNSVLRSSLMCWYNESCINNLYGLFQTAGIENIPHANALDPQFPSQYAPNTSVDTIFNELMIEKWNSSVSYQNFYKKCNPTYCSYSYERRANIIYIITTIIGLFGGLNIVFRLASPFIISSFFKCINLKMISERSSERWINEQDSHQNRFSCSGIFHHFRYKLLLLNLFDSESTEPFTIHRERLSTRVYIPILFIGLCSITIYTSLLTETSNITVSYPSQSEYQRLSKVYFDTLQCPCSQISVLQNEFITITNTYHQVCSSDFIKDIWLQCMLGDQEWFDRYEADLRGRGASYFLFLSLLCTLSQRTVNSAIDEFLNSAFVNAQMISESEFQLQTAVIFNQFKTSTAQKYSRILTLVYEITESSAFVSSYSMNWFWWLKYNSSIATIPTKSVEIQDGCYCGTRSNCTTSGGFYNPYSNIVNFTIPGFNVGCSPVKTLLQSTLECFYNQTCTDLVLYYATIDLIGEGDIHSFVNVSAMDSTRASRFKTDILIQELVDELFVEEWQTNISYSSFYNKCAIAYCSYEVERPHNFIYIVSKIIGLYGGLSVALRFIVPHINKIAFVIRNRCRRNTVSSFA